MTAGAQAARERREAFLHRTWRACILVKGVHAAFEIASAALVWRVSPGALGRWAWILLRSEIAEDPGDPAANWVLHAAGGYSADTKHFAVAYLLAVGGVNLVLVCLLWRRKLWAFPLLAGILALFIVYQAMRWTRTHSPFLLVLCAFDALLIGLALREHRRMRSGLAAP